jgi:hypothetical protein
MNPANSFVTQSFPKKNVKTKIANSNMIYSMPDILEELKYLKIFVLTGLNVLLTIETLNVLSRNKMVYVLEPLKLKERILNVNTNTNRRNLQKI